MNTSWQVSFDVVIAAAPSGFTQPRPPAVPAASTGGHMQAVQVSKGTDPMPQMTLPFFVTGFWDHIADNVSSVTEVGTETLPLNGVPSACHMLQVQYKGRESAPSPPPATYSICSDRHLVLKKTILYPADRHGTDPPSPWTVTFDTATFGQPAPPWVLAMKDIPAVSTRKEWLKRTAPPFELPDLTGKQVALSSMRGQVVLLDFWSIGCGPCIRAMPDVEAAVKRQTRPVTLWEVSIDTAAQDKKWLAGHNESLYTLIDGDFAVSDLYKVQGIPALVLIGRDGKIREYWEGVVPQPELEAALRDAARD